MMERQDVIPASEFCVYHQVSYTFIENLHDAGLVDIDIIEEQPYLHLEQLSSIEPLVRLHTELDINTEGVEAIAYLLQRLTAMQRELRALQQRIELYEKSV